MVLWKAAQWFNSSQEDLLALISLVKYLPVSVLALQTQHTCAAHSMAVFDDSLITVDTTSLDQDKLCYGTIALICQTAKVKTIPLESKASIKPNENSFYTP